MNMIMVVLHKKQRLSAAQERNLFFMEFEKRYYFNWPMLIQCIVLIAALKLLLSLKSYILDFVNLTL